MAAKENQWDQLGATAPAGIGSLVGGFAQQGDVLVVPARAWSEMQTELVEMRRFVRSMLAVEARRRAVSITRVQARWRGLVARRSLEARVLQARLRMRWITSPDQLHVSTVAPRPSSLARGLLHAVVRGFLVRRRSARYRTHHRAASLVQAIVRGRRDRRLLRIPSAQHHRLLHLEAQLSAERHARLTHEGVLRTMFTAMREMQDALRASSSPIDSQVSVLGTPPLPEGKVRSSPKDPFMGLLASTNSHELVVPAHTTSDDVNEMGGCKPSRNGEGIDLSPLGAATTSKGVWRQLPVSSMYLD